MNGGTVGGCRVFEGACIVIYTWFLNIKISIIIRCLVGFVPGMSSQVFTLLCHFCAATNAVSGTATFLVVSSELLSNPPRSFFFGGGCFFFKVSWALISTNLSFTLLCTLSSTLHHLAFHHTVISNVISGKDWEAQARIGKLRQSWARALVCLSEQLKSQSDAK